MTPEREAALALARAHVAACKLCRDSGGVSVEVGGHRHHVSHRFDEVEYGAMDYEATPEAQAGLDLETEP